MSRQYTESEDNGWYYLCESPQTYDCTSSGDLGGGGGINMTRFRSAEGRDYYKQARYFEDAARVAQRERDCLRRELAKIVTKRDVRKRIRALLEGK
jgi:hypothetical protein